jgi:serine/threonine protein kinase
MSGSSERDPLEQVTESFLARWRAGERPAVSEYEKNYPELAADIRELFPALVMMEQGRECVEKPPGSEDSSSPPQQVPDRLGEYHLLREIGRGGMGVVYEAFQESLGRHVALKVLPSNPFGRAEQLERFRREARAAARLHHTNIVPVFGVGEHQGIHYYAMQFIHGQGLDAVLEELRRLRTSREPTAMSALATNVAQRLLSDQLHPGGIAPTIHEGASPLPAPSRPLPPAPDLSSASGISSNLNLRGPYYAGVARIGLQAAEALAYAHSQGVVHRDIKPSNLLLDTEGRVWITDFGLAKAEDSEELTQPGAILGTLRYMAPERFHGQADARSDVYALGATLYELLTLRPAFDQPHREMLVEQILHREPPPPRKIDPRIPRDLETSVLKAMSKEPARRYASAADLAEDLRRILADRPIRARRTPWRERAWRWCRRNPGVASLMAALWLVLLVGTAAVSWQWRRAETHLQTAQDEHHEADRQRKQADLFARKAHQAFEDAFTELSESKLLEVPGAQPLRRELLTRAVSYYQEFLGQRTGDPEIQADLAAACFRVATLYISLEQLDEAVAAVQHGVDYVETLYREHPQDPRWRPRLAGFFKNFRSHLTHVHTSKRLPSRPLDAFQTLQRAATVWQRLARENPQLPAFQTDLTIIHLALAGALARADFPSQALVSYETARTLAEQLVHRHPNDFLARELLTYAYPKMADRLESQSRFDQAEALFQGGIRLFENCPTDLAQRPHVQAQLGVILSDLGMFLEKRKRLDEAEKKLGRAIVLLEKAVAQPPGQDYRRDLALCNLTLARVVKKRPAEAEKACRQALALYDKLVAEFPGAASYQMGAAEAWKQLAGLLEASRPEEAEAAYRHALHLNERLVAAYPQASLYWQDLDRTFRAMLSLLEARRPGEVVPFLRQEGARIDKLGEAALAETAQPARRLRSFAQRLLAWHAAESSPAEAVEAARHAVQIAQQLVADEAVADNREELGHARFALARACRYAQNFPEAARTFGEAAQVFTDLVKEFPARPAYQEFVAITYSHTGDLHDARGEPDRAVAMYHKAIALYEQLTREAPGAEEYQRGLASTCHLSLARLLIERGRLQEAERPLRRALELWEKLGNHFPSNTDLTHLQRCQTALLQVLLAMGRPDEAAAVSQRALDKLQGLAAAYPGSTYHQVLVAWFLVTCPDVRIRDAPRALPILRAAIDREPGNGFFQLGRAVALYRTGDWNATLDALEETIALYGGDSWPWFFLAMTHWQRGDKQTARRWYAKADAWMQHHRPRDEELREFRAEAARLIGSSPP